MSGQLVIYGGAAMQQLPKALRAVVGAARTVGEAVALVKRSAWYLSLAKRAQQSVLAAFQSGAASLGPARQPSKGIIGIQQPAMSTQRIAYNRGSVSGSITQRHREFVMDVKGSSGFEITQFLISPSNRDLFKSLSYIARCFDKYRFLKLRFVYVPSCSNATGGRVASAFEYNPTDPPPVDKQEVYAMEGSKRNPYYERMVIDMAAGQWLNVNFDPVEPKTSVGAAFYFASMEATSTSTVLGELYVEYEVELKIATKFVPSTLDYRWTQGALTATQLADPTSVYTVAADATGVLLTFKYGGKYRLSYVVSNYATNSTPSFAGVYSFDRTFSAGSGSTYVYHAVVKLSKGAAVKFGFTSSASLTAVFDLSVVEA